MPLGRRHRALPGRRKPKQSAMSHGDCDARALALAVCLPHRVFKKTFSIASKMLNQRQCRASDRTRVRPDRARDNVDVTQAPPIEAGEDLRRAGGEALADSRWKCAVDH